MNINYLICNSKESVMVEWIPADFFYSAIGTAKQTFLSKFFWKLI